MRACVGGGVIFHKAGTSRPISSKYFLHRIANCQKSNASSLWSLSL